MKILRNKLGNRIKISGFFAQHQVKWNQRSIIRLATSTNNIALNPVPPFSAGGHVEHYYHFIFDLLLPLSFIIKKTPSNVIFSLNGFGVLTPILLKLFDNRVRIRSNAWERKVNLIGMNPIQININHFQYKNLKEMVCEKLNIDSTSKPNKILLIECIPPDPYYQTSATIKGSGSSRRSIKNHDELEKYIRSKVSPNYEFHNLKLEKISFEDQIRYFDSAVAVIAQHGAGLANILWMPEKSVVIEFGFNSKNHYERLSLLMKHYYFLFDNKEPHIKIDCVDFSNWLSKNEITRDFFIDKNNLKP